MSSPPTSPTSPRRAPAPTAGFLPRPKALPKPVHLLSLDGLQERYEKNQAFLRAPGAASPQYIVAIHNEQAAIMERRSYLLGSDMDEINGNLSRTTIKDEQSMDVDAEVPAEKTMSRTVATKMRVLARKYGVKQGIQESSHTTEKDGHASKASASKKRVAIMNFAEAEELEEYRVRQDMERRRKVEAKQDKLREITYAQLSEKEKQARIYAFMNVKPSDSDIEDDSDDEDPAKWFQDSDDEADKHGANFESLDDHHNEYTQHAISIAPDA